MTADDLVILIFPVSAFSLTAWLTHRFCNLTSRFRILDYPNERSLHAWPTPRTGGIVILIAIYIFSMLATFLQDMTTDLLVWIGGGGLLVAGVSYVHEYLNDRSIWSVVYRLATHTAAASLLIYAGLSIEQWELPGLTRMMPGWFSALFSVLFVVWLVNLYNFMDGIDGHAAGMAVFGFGSFAFLAWMAGDLPFMTVNLVVTAAAGGFLLFNFPPARIFMGDVGSSLLGFLAAAFSLWANSRGIFPLWIAALIFSPFIIDATVTLIRRLFRGEKVWQAHKTHYYQRLVQLGWGHKKTVLFEYGLMLGCGLTALLVVHATTFEQCLALSAWVLLYVCLFPWVAWLETRGQKTYRPHI